MNTKNEKKSCESLDFVEKLQKAILPDEEKEVEKGIKTIIVPPTEKRKGYQYQRNFPDHKKNNVYKGKNIELLNDRKKEKEAKINLLQIMNEDFYNYCKNNSIERVIKKYSDESFKPILNVPYRFMKLFPMTNNSFVYCGKQTLGRHINKHKDVKLSVFQDMQKVLNNTNNVYIEKKATSPNGIKGIAFEVMDFKGERYAMVVRTDKQGRLIFWKSFHIQRDVQNKWKKINLAKLKQGLYKSVEDGQLSILRILGTSSSDLSAFPDNLSIPYSQKKSSRNITKSLFTDWKVELRHLCDKKGLNYDSVIQKYDDKLTRYVAEEQLHQDAENVIAYKAYKDLNKSLTISDKLFRLWQRRLSPELQKEMKKYIDEHSRVFSLFSSYKDVYDIKGYPKGLDLENNILMELADTYFVVSCGGDWQDEKLVKFSIGEDDKLKAEVVDKCDKEDKRVLNKKLAYIINPSEIKKSLTYSGYKLQGRTRLYGMDISIENKKGTYRKGVDSDGHKWKTLMHYDYGYIRGTVGTDSDHVDCYIGPDKNSKKVYVIHQNNPITHKYDEDKCMLCFESADAAKKAYMKQYDRPGFFGSMETLTVEQFKTFVFSKQGSKIHKSFNVEITDITENNKNQKVEQLQKALYALYEQKPFVINHISTENDKSKRYNDVTLRINNFNKDKIEKAVHSVAMTLDTSVKTSKGEPFMFKSQEDLTNRIISQFLKTTRKLYLFLIKYFDLPEIDVMTKSTMIWKGKIIYNPETGKPLTNIEWNKFVKALDDFVNRNYKGIGDRIILSSETLGRILDRMAKYNTLKNITELKLEDIKYSGKTFDWISESVKNLKNTFGESLDRTQTARIEVMQQSATQYIKNIEDQLKNKIKQTLIDGIKNRESKTQVSQNLFNNCVGINRDFQRWADSEVQAAATKAYIAEVVYNSPDKDVYFKRREIVDDNTCTQCKTLNGVVVKYSKVPLTDEHIKDDFAKYAIWDGKTTGHIPETIQHPYCRGCWLQYSPMKSPIVDALSTIKEKNNNKWDKAVEQAKKEFEDKGIKNPNDKTKGYVARIREIYNEK